MKTSLKKLSLAVLVSTVLLGAQANAQNHNIEGTALVTLSKLEKTIKSSTSSIAGLPVKLADGHVSFMESTKSEYVPVFFSGKRFLTNETGTALFDPNTVFFIADSGIIRASNVLLEFDFSGDNATKWPTRKLADGVTKRGDMFVITDPTCGFCHKVEEEILQYLENGIEVHLIPYPRTGMNPDAPAYQKWAKALCSAEPALAYNDISLGKGEEYSLPIDLNGECTSLIQDGLELGATVGVTGTPFMYGISINGDSFSQAGYVPVKEFAAQIGVVIKSTGINQIIK
jgi:hypothetical protein